MRAEEARTRCEANKAKCLKREYDTIKGIIAHYADQGKRGIHTPTICWPETLEILRKEGYEADDLRITWA